MYDHDYVAKRKEGIGGEMMEKMKAMKGEGNGWEAKGWGKN